MKPPFGVTTFYRFIPAARHQEFEDKLKAAGVEARLKSEKAPTLAQFFELREPKREPGFFKWFSYVAQVIGAAWTNRERIDDRKLVLVGMKSVLELRRKTVAGFDDALDGERELKSLRDRSVTELAADANVNIGDLAGALAKQLSRVNVDAQGSPYLVAESMNEEECAAQAEINSELREARMRPSIDRSGAPRNELIPSSSPQAKRPSGEAEAAPTRLGRSERRQRALSSRSRNTAGNDAKAEPVTRASLPTDFRQRIEQFVSIAVENWAQLPGDVRHLVIRKLAAEAVDAPPQAPEHWASRAKEISDDLLKLLKKQ